MTPLPPRKFWDTSRCPQCGQKLFEQLELDGKTSAYCPNGPCTEIDEAAAHLLNFGATGKTFKEACDNLHKQYEEFTEQRWRENTNKGNEE